LQIIDVSPDIKVRSIYKRNSQEQNKVEGGSTYVVLWKVKPCSLR